ncbi:hypothetical protein NEOLEDRAFT_343682 [Neolentinus lepideus HHB14362 ss-1]|uniref:Uncharacterized protein n=1 Tax=Neolentinus lepideus HHB14362 ss-1 TaxID=1314782 RepID=A0A165SPD3_9AGAM|nr:hypothetical protein NEOLEDRAFT_343682 [Neolentinus lepideus HHB14362 ss-1]
MLIKTRQGWTNSTAERQRRCLFAQTSVCGNMATSNCSNAAKTYTYPAPHRLIRHERTHLREYEYTSVCQVSGWTNSTTRTPRRSLSGNSTLTHLRKYDHAQFYKNRRDTCPPPHPGFKSTHSSLPPELHKYVISLPRRASNHWLTETTGGESARRGCQSTRPASYQASSEVCGGGGGSAS